MAEFQLDTSGVVAASASPTFETIAAGGGDQIAWHDLDAFTQGYIEAAFFTEQEPIESAHLGGDASALEMDRDPFGFADLAPAALATMIADCEAFQVSPAVASYSEAGAGGKLPRKAPMIYGAEGGHDFWLTRNGHGAGFWDGDWPEPYASELTAAAKAFGEVSLILSDDGKIHHA